MADLPPQPAGESTDFHHHRVETAVADDFHRPAHFHHFAPREDIEELIAEPGLAAGAYRRNRHARKYISHGIVGELGVDRPELLHGTGTTLTQLRPSGTTAINGQRVDVVAEGGLIERGTAVRVVAVEGSRIVVRVA